MTHVNKHTGIEEPYSQDVRLHAGWYTAETDNVALLFDTAFKTGNMRCLSFHNTVNGGDPDSVLEFEKRCKAYTELFLEEHPEVAKVTLMSIDGTTPQEERNRILAVLDATPSNELSIVCSCKTISEGVNTRRCNLVYFVHPSRSYVSIVQRIGRAVRLQPGCPPATLLIPCFANKAEMEALPKEEQDAYIRTQLYAEGNALFDFLGAIREGDADLLDLLVDMYKGPQTERLNHYTELLGDRRRVTLAEAVERATGERTEDVATAAVRTKRSVEVHPREGPVAQHEGAAAIEASIIEMEPGRYVVAKGAVREAPRQNRIVVDTSFSPFLQSIHFDEVFGTAIIDYELRPELFEERVQEVIKFVEENGRLPSWTIKDPDEKRLATWCTNFRRNKGKNPEKDDRVQKIPMWSWDPLEDQFEANLQSTIKFVKDRNQLPSTTSKDLDEKRLGQWIHNYRKRRGKNPEKDARVQKIPIWSWDPYADQFEANLQSTTAFVEKNERLPSQSSIDSTEKPLGQWCSGCRKYRGKNPEKDARVGRIPGWYWSEEKEAATYQEMTVPKLQILLRDRELSAVGTKAALIARLESSDLLAGSPEEVMEEDPAPMEGEPNSTIDDVLTEIEEEFEPSPKRTRDDGLEHLSKEELVERLRDMKRQSSRGYMAPNPEMKDEINALFASSLPPARGKVAFLDHTDFKTATASAAHGVYPEDMIIPQMDEAAFAQMRRHPTFGASVVFGEFNEVMSRYHDSIPFRGVYADFTGPLACGLELVEVCKGLTLAPSAVVGVTVTLRDPTGNDSFTNAAIEQLSNEMNEELDLVTLRDAEGNKVRPMTYGSGAPMVTIIKRKRD